MSLTQRCDHAIPFGNVAEENGHVIRAGIGVKLHHPVRKGRRGFEVDRFAALHGTLVFGLIYGAAGGRKNFEEPAADHLLAGLAEMAKSRVVYVSDPPFPVEGEEAVGDAVHDDRQPSPRVLRLDASRLQFRLLPPQGLLGSL